MELYYYILQGEGSISLEGYELEVRIGDWVFVPNNWQHLIKPKGDYYPIRAIIFGSYSDRKTSELLPVGTDPLNLFKKIVPYDNTAVEFMNRLALASYEAASTGVSVDLGGSLYREADFYTEVASECFGKNDLGVRKYATLAINMIQRFIEDTKRWESYKSNVNRLKANIANFKGEWLHKETSVDWFVFADDNYMKPEWNRPVTPYTQLIVEWMVPGGKAFHPHTHNTEEFYYQLSSITGMKIGPIGTNELTGDEEEFFLYPGEVSFQVERDHTNQLA